VSLSKVGQHEIYRLGLGGNIIRRLTVNPAIEISPSWSPNGRDIVFTSDQTGSPQIYIMAADGSNKSRLTYEGRYNDAAAWSSTPPVSTCLPSWC
jgi:TolB protein